LVLPTRSHQVYADPPQISALPDTTIHEDTSTPDLQFQVTDPDSDPLTVRAISGDPTLVPDRGINLKGSGSTRTVRIAPAHNRHGQTSVTIIAEDDTGASSEMTFGVAVSPVNDPPVGIQDSYATAEDARLRVDASTGVLANDTDVDTERLTAHLLDAPAHGDLTIDDDGGFTYTPALHFSGVDSFTYEVFDGQFRVGPVAATVVVEPVNDPPILDAGGFSEPHHISDGEEFRLDVRAVDADGDTLRFASPNLPAGASFDSDTGRLSWRPAFDQVGTWQIGIRVTDGVEIDSRPLTVEVYASDDDLDGVPDALETASGLDHTSADSDGDTIADFDEVGDPAAPMDTDGDGRIDARDLDSDGDGILDSTEAGDADLTTAPMDTDADGVPDFRDTDSDDDGVFDFVDVCVRVVDPTQADLDGDLVGDACDLDLDGDGVDNDDERHIGTSPREPDSDGDTLLDLVEIGSDPRHPLDTDDDGVIDARSPDSDGDGIFDLFEAGDDDRDTDPVDTDEDGTPDYRDLDSDGDGIVDAWDNCRLVANLDQSDADGDAAGNACDGDVDGDGIPDESDNCPHIFNEKQHDFDGDGTGAVCDADDENDGIIDTEDNCPALANEDQLDNDGDGLGDACDDDDDGDGLSDDEDNCALVFNEKQHDTDGDGRGDACDPVERCGSGQDEDGDGLRDCADSDCHYAEACTLNTDPDSLYNPYEDVSVGGADAYGAETGVSGAQAGDDLDEPACTLVRLTDSNQDDSAPWPAWLALVGLVGLMWRRRR